MPELYY